MFKARRILAGPAPAAATAGSRSILVKCWAGRLRGELPSPADAGLLKIIGAGRARVGASGAYFRLASSLVSAASLSNCVAKLEKLLAMFFMMKARSAEVPDA